MNISVKLTAALGCVLLVSCLDVSEQPLPSAENEQSSEQADSSDTNPASSPSNDPSTNPADDDTNEAPRPDEQADTPTKADKPLFINSIVSTDFDFITAEDPSAFLQLHYKGQKDSEMPDARPTNNELFDRDSFVFEAEFSDGSTVGLYAHSTFGSKAAAQAYAMKATGPLGRLPQLMRSKLSHVVIHKGDHTAFGESEGHFFVLYSDNMDTRIANHDLEETVFHESVHATLDQTHASKAEWKNAQSYDGVFITEYGERKPDLEDLAESAIFAYTMAKHPGRLPFEVEDWIRLNTPNRLSYFATVFP